MGRRTDIYGGKDPRLLPFYSFTEAALCLRIPVITLRQWTLGRGYPTKTGDRVSRPLITAADPGRRLLSFVNLLEGQALRAFRNEHGLRLSVIRAALASLEVLDGDAAKAHPLAFEQFLTDRLDIFVERVGQLITLNPARQIAIREAFRNDLKRIQRDETGPVALFPWVGGEWLSGTPVTINPRVGFGRPTVTGTGISTAVLASLVRAGESVDSVAEDYVLSIDQVTAAIRFEEAA